MTFDADRGPARVALAAAAICVLCAPAGAQTQPAGPSLRLQAACTVVSAAGPPGSTADELHAVYEFSARVVDQSGEAPRTECRFDVATPAQSGGRWVLAIHGQTATALLSAEVQAGATLVGSDIPSADLEVLIPPDFSAGTLTVRRVDLGTDPLKADIRIRFVTYGPGDDGMDALAGRGQSFQAVMPQEDYRTFIRLARASTTESPVDSPTKREAHDSLSRLIGRNADAWRDRATRSEPMVVFVGLSGANRIVLLDQVGRIMPAARDRDGHKYAEPWQSTFEKSRSFWAVYLEDEATPFFTSIDAQFRRASPSEHDDFDPQGIARLEVDDQHAGEPRRVRIGVKRFRMPDLHDTVQVMFTRQSAGYGLRQWGRTFTRHGSWRFAPGVFVTDPVITRNDFTLTPVFVDGSLTPASYAIDVNRTRQPVFVTLATRSASLRDSERQARGLERKLRRLVPEPIVGIGLPTVRSGKGLQNWLSTQSLLFALSIPIVGNDVHLVVGAVRKQQPYLNGDLTTAERLPDARSLDDIRTLRASWKFVLGVGIDVRRTWFQNRADE
ncbi:MAG: hypothetical protein R2745_14935 [Vicinamibacterales bacterium]